MPVTVMDGIEGRWTADSLMSGAAGLRYSEGEVGPVAERGCGWAAGVGKASSTSSLV